MAGKLKQLRVLTLVAGCGVIVLSAFLCGCNSQKDGDADGNATTKKDDADGNAAAKKNDADKLADAHNTKAIAYLKKGRYSDAIAACKKAIAIKSDYAQLLDRQSVNPEFDHIDAVLVIGANDMVNPAARSDETSPIYGMPILDVDKAGTVMVCKRTLNPGFAGIDNELFYQDNTAMIFGDAKKTVTEIIAALKE